MVIGEKQPVASFFCNGHVRGYDVPLSLIEEGNKVAPLRRHDDFKTDTHGLCKPREKLIFIAHGFSPIQIIAVCIKACKGYEITPFFNIFQVKSNAIRIRNII